MKRELYAGLITILAAVAPTASAQVSELAPQNGLYISAISANLNYFSQGVPKGIIPPGDVFLGSNWGAQSGMDLDWREFRDKSTFAFHSSSSFGKRFGTPTVNGWNSDASVRFSKTLGTKWGLSIGGGETIMNFDQALFRPSTLSIVASVPSTYDAFSSAVLTGQSSNPQLDNAGFRPDLTAEQFLFGRRTMSASAQATLSYAYSRRLKIGTTGSYMTLRHVVDPSDPIGIVFPKSNAAAGGVDITYSLSPRTQIGGGVSMTQTTGSVDTTKSTTATVSLSRTMSRRWFCQVRVGGGTSSSASQQSHQTALYSAGVGAKTSSHTGMFLYEHSLGDPFLVTLGTPWYEDTLTGTWHWARLSSGWAVDSDFSHTHVITNGLATTNTWHATIKMSRWVSRTLVASCEFTVGRVGARRYVVNGVTYQLAQTGGQFSLAWTPQKRLLR